MMQYKITLLTSHAVLGSLGACVYSYKYSEASKLKLEKLGSENSTGFPSSEYESKTHVIVNNLIYS